MKIKKAIIPAAGFGTRLFPLTRAQPKEMLPILDKPVLHYIVEELVESGVDEVLILVGKGKESIINYFDRNELDDKHGYKDIANMPEIFFVRQREQKGLGDAIKYAKKFVNDQPFAVMLGDTIYKSNTKKTITRQLLEAFEKKGSSTLAVERVAKSELKNYGVISGKTAGERMWEIDRMVEKPEPAEAPSDIALTGAYVLMPSIFDYLDKIERGRNNEYQLTDALNLMCKKEKVFGYQIDGSKYDIGTKELWIKTFIEFAKADKRFSNLL